MLKIYRKRFIPDEIVDISGDEVLKSDEDILVTRWKAIKPRNDLKGGISFAFLKKGYKISRIYDHADNFCFWYCDIIDSKYYMDEDKYLITDLLVDVRVKPSGEAEILDLDELAYALENGLIDSNLITDTLKKLDGLLKIIYSGTFPPKECREYEYLK